MKSDQLLVLGHLDDWSRPRCRTCNGNRVVGDESGVIACPHCGLPDNQFLQVLYTPSDIRDYP